MKEGLEVLRAMEMELPLLTAMPAKDLGLHLVYQDLVEDQEADHRAMGLQEMDRQAEVEDPLVGDHLVVDRRMTSRVSCRGVVTGSAGCTSRSEASPRQPSITTVNCST